jgi:nitroreductase
MVFSACPRRPPPTGITLKFCCSCHIHRRTALHSIPASKTITSLPLDIANANTNAAAIFDAVVNARYACTRFHRHQEPKDDNGGQFPSNANCSSGINKNRNNTSITSSSIISKLMPQQPTASLSNPQIIQIAHQSLLLSQRAPSGFNAQPYRIILVHSQQEKEKVAQYCLGRNADRVRDSDCTAIFLADTGVGHDGGRYIDFLKRHMIQMNEGKEVEFNDSNGNATSITSLPSLSTTTQTKAKSTISSRSHRSLSPRELLKVRLLILLFSSGYPLPSILSVPLSFFVRLGISILATIMRWLHSIQQRLLLSSTTITNRKRTILSRFLSSLVCHRHIQLLPTLSTSQTWSQKNTMLVAMTYILSCTSHGLATCPMEGIDAVGVKKVLGVDPMQRYSIPLIVSTGLPYQYHHSKRQHVRDVEEDGEEEEAITITTTMDDAGLSHGRGALLSPRYPSEEVVYDNFFGMPFQ